MDTDNAEGTTAPVVEAPEAPVSDPNDFYSGILKDVPEGQRPIVEPYAKEWQTRVGKKFDELHSQLKPLEPFKELIDNGYEYDDIVMAVNLAQSLQEDPQRVYQLLHQQYGGQASGQGPTEQQQSDQDSEDDPTTLELRQLREQQAALTERFQQEDLTRKQAEQQQLIEDVISTLHEQHGDFDDVYVLNLMLAGADPEDAVKQFNETVETWATKRNPANASAPTILGAGGGVPVPQGIDPTTLDDKATKNLVAQLLESSRKV